MQIFQTVANPPGNGQVKTPEPAINILLIEDNIADARLVELLLGESDLLRCHFVNKVTLTAGMEALANPDNHFAAVLLDLTLPDSRGFETLEKLIARFPDVTVIVMTGLDDKSLGLKSVQAGAQDFIVKGDYDGDQLAKTLRYAIERSSVLKRLEETKKAKEVAEESAKLKEQFIAGISHEMRTPMNAIYGMSNLLCQTNLSGEQTNFVNSIKQSSEVLLGIINDILEISSMQNGKTDFDIKDFDLREVMKNLVSVMEYKKNEKPLVFNLTVAPNVPQYIQSDKLRLNQVLYNLVGNAIKFTDAGQVKIDVNVVGQQEGKAVLQFRVEDSGIGMPADKLEAIFDTFTRIRTKNRLFEGTGLGLSIVKNLVDQQGGRVWAESIIGEGSTFYVHLPFHVGSNPADIVVESEIFFDLPADYTFRLLLVEDHRMNQIVAQKTLEKKWSNIQMTIANNGQEATEILARNTFDVILMDLQMPILDGYEATSFIRNNMPAPVNNLPILAMTAHAHISKDEKLKSYGFDDFVLKPFEPKQLFSKISEYVLQGRH